jgi:hypothetical protein
VTLGISVNEQEKISVKVDGKLQILLLTNLMNKAIWRQKGKGNGTQRALGRHYDRAEAIRVKLEVE